MKTMKDFEQFEIANKNAVRGGYSRVICTWEDENGNTFQDWYDDTHDEYTYDVDDPNGTGGNSGGGSGTAGPVGIKRN